MGGGIDPCSSKRARLPPHRRDDRLRLIPVGLQRGEELLAPGFMARGITDPGTALVGPRRDPFHLSQCSPQIPPPAPLPRHPRPHPPPSDPLPPRPRPRDAGAAPPDPETPPPAAGPPGSPPGNATHNGLRPSPSPWQRLRRPTPTAPVPRNRPPPPAPRAVRHPDPRPGGTDRPDARPRTAGGGLRRTPCTPRQRSPRRPPGALPPPQALLTSPDQPVSRSPTSPAGCSHVGFQNPHQRITFQLRPGFRVARLRIAAQDPI